MTDSDVVLVIAVVMAMVAVEWAPSTSPISTQPLCPLATTAALSASRVPGHRRRQQLRLGLNVLLERQHAAAGVIVASAKRARPQRRPPSTASVLGPGL